MSETAAIEEGELEAEQHASRLICSAVEEARAARLSPRRRHAIARQLRAVLPASEVAWHLAHLSRRLERARPDSQP